MIGFNKKINKKSIQEFIVSLVTMGFWGFVAIAAVVFCVTIIFAIIGWAIVTVASIFITVTVSGYWSYTAIGIAVCIVAAVFSRD